MKKSLNICIIFNPSAGSGRSQSVAESLAKSLRDKVAQVTLKQSSPELKTDAQLNHANLVIVAGGDGTMMQCLPFLIDLKLPVYMLPTGNESLFAREFNMSADTPSVISAIEKWKISKHHVGLINNTLFFTMVSLGLDSEVIEKISKFRKSGISRLGYIYPLLKAALLHKPPTISLSVDGEDKIINKSGFLIIANNSQYALGTAFVPEAESSHPSLCARFFPYKSTLSFFGWCIKSLYSLSIGYKTPPLMRGNKFSIKVHSPKSYPLQADGEFINSSNSANVLLGNKYLHVLHP